ncbi:MAG: TIM barrel protein [Gammaproteobacteria bacterium]|nr:TIM barrel protein [Gammaproteobacteria bacterium]
MLYNEVDFLQRYELAAEDGFSGVECLFPYAYSAAEVNAVRADAGIPQVLFNTSAGDWQAGERGMACHPDKAADFRASLQQALHYACVLNTPLVHTMAGLLPTELELVEAEQVYVENMIWAAKEAAKAHVILTMEAINPIDMPGYMLTTQEQAANLLARIAAVNVKLQFDFFHCQKYQGDSLQRLLQVFDQVAHIQIAGVPDRHEPDTGEWDYQQVFALLKSHNYQGFVGCEYRPAGGTRDGLVWRQTVL